MTTTEKVPTREQQEKFWEWCGLKPFSSYELDLNLNNLFKWAIPNLPSNIALSLIKHGDRPNYYCRIQGFYAEDKPIITVYDNPALALFWAIWEVIDK